MQSLENEQDVKEMWRDIVGEASQRPIQRVHQASRSSWIQVWQWSQLAVRRTIVLLVGSGAVLGSGLLGRYLSDSASPILKEVVPTGLMFLSTSLFIKILSPINRRLEPVLERESFRLAGTHHRDVWGKIRSMLSENDIEQAQQIFSQLLLFSPLLKRAGTSLEKKDFRDAAEYYVAMVLLSQALFGKLHLDHLASLIFIDLEIPVHVSGSELQRLMEEVNFVLNDIPKKTLDDLNVNRQDFCDFARKTIYNWFTQRTLRSSS